MDREKMNETLSKLLGREAKREEITEVMNLVNEDNKTLIADAVSKKETELKASFDKDLSDKLAAKETEIAKKYESYKTADEYNDILNQLNTFKSEQKKQELTAKLLEAGIKNKESVLNYVTNELKAEEEGFEERLKAFVENKDNSEFMASPEQKKNDGYGNFRNPAKTIEGITSEMLAKDPNLAKILESMK